MTHTGCPGQDTRYWKPGDIFETRCADCGRIVEFFKDDVARTCQCGSRIENPRIDRGCAQWCPQAEGCLTTPVNTVDDGPHTALRGRLIAAMKNEFGDDTRRIDHALAVLFHADAIREAEGGDVTTVTAAAILHDIGIQEGERLYGSPAPRYQELLGPPIARRIMEGLGMDETTVEHVVRIVGSHHSAKDIDTTEFRVIWDADALVNLGDEERPRTADGLSRLIDKVFRTGAGRRRARRVLG
jgi:hypothetical protein